MVFHPVRKFGSALKLFKVSKWRNTSDSKDVRSLLNWRI